MSVDPIIELPEADTDHSTPCVVKDGEVAYIYGGGLMLPDGRLVNYEDCRFEVGSSLSLGLGDESMTPVPPKRHHKKEMHVDPISTEPVADHSAPPAPEPQPAPPAPTHETAPATAVPDMAMGGETSLAGAVGAAAFLKDNPWAPLVMVALAALAVVGGRQGWKFWSERSAQNHELEMKKLELQAQAHQTPTQQPPPCAVKQVDTEAKLTAFDAKISALEARVKSLESASEQLGDFDPSDAFEGLDKRVKKLEKAAKPAASHPPAKKD